MSEDYESSLLAGAKIVEAELSSDFVRAMLSAYAGNQLANRMLGLLFPRLPATCASGGDVGLGVRLERFSRANLPPESMNQG